MQSTFVTIGILLLANKASSDSGDCPDLDNVQGRNFLFNNTFEVGPCGPNKIRKCTKKDGCSTISQPSSSFPYKLILSQYNPKLRFIKVGLVVLTKMEFFIEAHQEVNGTYKQWTLPLGHFEDIYLEGCNSYACCDPMDPSKTNVARRCISPGNKTVIPKNNSSYKVAYKWIPPTDFQGGVIFVGTYIESSSLHWKELTSNVIYVKNLDLPEKKKEKEKSEEKPEPEEFEPKGKEKPKPEESEPKEMEKPKPEEYKDEEVEEAEMKDPKTGKRTKIVIIQRTKTVKEPEQPGLIPEAIKAVTGLLTSAGKSLTGTGGTG